MAKVVTLRIDLESSEAEQGLARIERGFKGTTEASEETSAAVKRGGAAHREAAKSATEHAGSVELLTRRAIAYVSANAVISAIKSTAAWADELQTLSRRADISVGDLLRLDFAAKSNGSTINTVVNAVTELGQRLAGGEQSVERGLKRLHIGFDEVRNGRPDDVFLRLSKAVREIEDPFERSRVVMELFGRSGRELLPLLTSDVDGLMRKADELGQVLDPLTVERLENADSALEQMTTSGKVLLAEFLEPAVPLITALAEKDLSRTAASLTDIAVNLASFGFLKKEDITAYSNFVRDVATGSLDKSGPSVGAPKNRNAAQPLGPASMGQATPYADWLQGRVIEQINDEIAETNRLLDEQERQAKELTKELLDLESASKRAYDSESIKLARDSTQALISSTRQLKEEFAEIVLSKEQFATRRIENDAGAARREVLDRGSQGETDELLRQIEARRQLQQLMLRRNPDGTMSDELVYELRALKDRFKGVFDEIPVLFSEQVPKIGNEAAKIPAAVNPHLDAMRTHAEQTFTAITVIAKSSMDLLADAQMMDFDAEMNLQRGDPFGVGLFQRQGAASKRRKAAQLSMHGFADGGIVGRHGAPIYLAGGGFARGSDTMPAMLTPGELVLNVAQQRNVAGAVGGTTVNVNIDARGAMFQDDAALERLADKVQKKMATVGIRVG